MDMLRTQTSATDTVRPTISRALDKLDSQLQGKEKYLEAIRAYRVDNFLEAVALLNQAAERDPQNPQVNKLLEKVNKLVFFMVESRKDFLGGKYVGAKTKVNYCLRIVDEIEFPNKPLEAKLEMKLSLIEFKIGERATAMAHVNKALQLNDIYINALLHRAHLHKLNKDWTETLLDLEKAEQNDSHLTKKPYKMWITEAKVQARRMRN